MKYQRVRGMQDLLPEDQPYWAHVEKACHDLAGRYGFERLEAPLLESTDLFVRGVGDATDIVSKEMYSFVDKGEDALTLRPEFTAGVMRAYIENGMGSRPQPQKLYSFGPIFRRERPAKGRYRQFYQFNAEVIGTPDALADLEIMQIAHGLYSRLGFTNLVFQLNSTGDPECKPRFIQALRDYFTPLMDRLAPLDRERLAKNPLRVLDTKERETLPLLADAPRFVDYLNAACAEHFAELRAYLDDAGIRYEINHRLVRGLDYYTKTVFELWGEGLGAQGALCGGGRYDGLIEALGGAPTPGVGFATGIERIIMSMRELGVQPAPLPRPDVFIAHLGPAAKRVAVQLAAQLRAEGTGVRVAFGARSLKAQMKDADRAGCALALLIGDDEVRDGTVTARDLAHSEQATLARADAAGWIRAHLP